MADKNVRETTGRKNNIISFRSKTGITTGPFSLEDTDAFCIQTEEIYYLSIIYQNPDGYYLSHGYATFKNGEKIKFTIADNIDEKVREKCILAGQSIAEKFGGTLMAGQIDDYGQFYRSAEQQSEMPGNK